MTLVTAIDSEPCAPPSGDWTIQCDDDAPESLDVGDFINANWEDLGADLEALYYCRPGEGVTFGGGAAPFFTVRRIA